MSGGIAYRVLTLSIWHVCRFAQGGDTSRLDVREVLVDVSYPNHDGVGNPRIRRWGGSVHCVVGNDQCAVTEAQLRPMVADAHTFGEAKHPYQPLDGL